MPKRGAIAVTLTAIALVLLLNFQTPGGPDSASLRTGAVGAPSPVAQVQASSGSSPQPVRTTTPGARTTPAPTPIPSAAPSVDLTGTRTLTGPVEDTRWGPVRVAVYMKGRQIVQIVALELPTGGRSGRISSFAAPLLHDQALRAQSASIDGVSGATYTTAGYEASLQAALDSAGS